MSERGDYRLRAMRDEDMRRVFDWRSRPEIAQYMFSDEEITLPNHRAWFEQVLARSDVDYRVLEYRGEPVGLANAVGIDPATRQCYWGFYIGATDAPKGSGSIMGEMMVQHIFATHPVDIIIGEAFAFNTASLKLHRKLGFEERPQLTHQVDKHGRSEAVIVMALRRGTTQPGTA